jgi:nicotinate dehydrogenase subunit A
MAKISLKVNGKPRVVDADPATPLLYILRNDLELNGPRFGCGLAQCGACTVIIDGKAVRSCVTPVRTVQNQAITTLEGLGNAANPHPLQKAFIEEQALQCGYCMNGILMNAKVLLDRNPDPTVEQIKEHLDPILCRCGSHLRVVRAIRRAAALVKA